MFAIGESLRDARTNRGLSPADVQKAIRIRERYLTALEEERWDMLPGEAYAKGFLRTYAEFLGLDSNLYMDEYNSRFTHRDEEHPFVPESFAVQRRRRGTLVPTLAGIVVLVALVAGVAAWRLGGGSNKPATRGQRPATVSKPAATTPAAATHGAAKKKALALPAVVPAAISATRGRCWLSIRTGGPTGPVVFEGTLEQGQSLHYRLRQSLWVRMGRPSMLDITVGGHAASGLPATPANLLLTRRGAQPA